MVRQTSSDVALELAVRADDAEQNPDKPITAGEYRRLFIKGLAALLRETDAISYKLRQTR